MQLVVSIPPNVPRLSITGQKGCSSHWTPSAYVQLVVSIPPMSPLSLYQARKGAVHIGHHLYICNWLFLPPPPPPIVPLSLYQAIKGALHIGHPLHMCNWLFLSPQCPPLSISGQKGCSTYWRLPHGLRAGIDFHRNTHPQFLPSLKTSGNQLEMRRLSFSRQNPPVSAGRNGSPDTGHVLLLWQHSYDHLHESMGGTYFVIS